MHIATRVKRYLAIKGVSFQTFQIRRDLPLLRAIKLVGIKPSELALPFIYQMNQQFLMVVTAANRQLSNSQLDKLLGHPVKLLPSTVVDKVFADCEPGAAPALSEPYHLRCVIDNEVLCSDKIYFVSGCASLLIGVAVDEFKFLNPSALFVAFSNKNSGSNTEQHQAVVTIKQTKVISNHHNQAEAPLSKELDSLIKWPEQPKLITQLLTNDINSAELLAELLKGVPGVEQQLVQYTSIWNSSDSQQNYSNKPEKLVSAIETLTPRIAANLAIGLLVMQQLKAPIRGVVGKSAWWRLALYSAYLAQKIASHTMQLQQQQHTAHLIGLMHQLGIIAIGHLYPPEFVLLNKMVNANPRKPVRNLASKLVRLGQANNVLRMGYPALGACLLLKWQWPSLICESISTHLQPIEMLQKDDMALLLSLVNSLLSEYQAGYCTTCISSEECCNALSIPKQLVQQLAKETLHELQGLDQIGDSLVA